MEKPNGHEYSQSGLLHGVVPVPKLLSKTEETPQKKAERETELEQNKLEFKSQRNLCEKRVQVYNSNKIKQQQH